MPYHFDDTIAAIANAPGPGLRGIVRASGPDVGRLVRTCFVPGDAQLDLDALRRATVVPGRLSLRGWPTRPQCDLYLWPSRFSYTRQPTAELHTLGSPPLLSDLLAQLCEAGARPAGPGEFTLRAFLSGRIDLTQAEAVAGIIDAADGQEFERALAQLAGGLAGPLGALRERLLDGLAHLEAGLDFVDEDIEFISDDQLAGELTEAAEVVRALVDRMAERTETDERVRLVLVGKPNVGKSSLFNALVARDAALVSPQAGTTRDYLTAPLDLNGLRCELIDTAGLEPVEALASIQADAQSATAAQQRSAHLELLCFDSTRPLAPSELLLVNTPASGLRLIVWTKSDRAASDSTTQSGVHVSARTGVGLDVLREQCRALALAARAGSGSVVATTAVRARESLRQALECLERASALVTVGGGHELVAGELRLALTALGDVVGAVHTDDLLDRVFSRFCIGK